MHAWTKTGETSEHPEPWGLYGAFTTMRLFPGGFLPFRDEHLDRLLSSAQKLCLPWIPEQAQLLDHLNEVLGLIPSEEDCLVRLCLFEDLLGIATRPAESDGNPVEGWLLAHRRPEPSIKSTADQKLYGSLDELDLKSEDWMIIDPKDHDLRETATSNLIFAEGNNLLIPDDRIRTFRHSPRSCFVEQEEESLPSPPFPNLDGLLSRTRPSLKSVPFMTN